MTFLLIIFASMLITVNAQRSPYAGARPASGYKDTYLPQTSSTTNGGTEIGNRDGDLGSSPSLGSTTERLPYDAHGDAAIVNHYNSLPFDQRPYWIVNQQHIENQRGTPSRSPPTSSTSQMTVNNPDVVNRFTGDGKPQGVNTSTNQIISQQEVVYPSNITPEQRLDMEIRFLQQRLEMLLEQRRQLQSQTSQQTMQTVSNPQRRNN